MGARWIACTDRVKKIGFKQVILAQSPPIQCFYFYFVFYGLTNNQVSTLEIGRQGEDTLNNGELICEKLATM